MQRLTERDSYGDVYVKQHDYVTAADKLAEYEDLEEQGLLLRLPCKVGDTAWNIRWWCEKEESVIVDGKKYYRREIKHKVSKDKFSLYDYPEFGKTVFLTKKEAEAKLREMEAGE